MKTLLILTAIFVSTATQAAISYNEAELQAKVNRYFKSEDVYIPGLGGCLENSKKQLECEWYIESGRTPDTIYATFEEINGELQVVKAWGEIGC